MKKHLFWSVPALSLALMACSPSSETEPEDPAANEEDTGGTSAGETEDGSKMLSQIKSAQQQAEAETEAEVEIDKPAADETDAGQIAEPVAAADADEADKPIDLLDETEADGEPAETQPDEEPKR